MRHPSLPWGRMVGQKAKEGKWDQPIINGRELLPRAFLQGTRLLKA